MTDNEPADMNAVLDLPMQNNRADAATIRDYLIKLLALVWQETDEFNGKRPFGNSGWTWDLYPPLVKAGFLSGEIDESGRLVEVNDIRGQELISQAIASLSSPAAPAGSSSTTTKWFCKHADGALVDMATEAYARDHCTRTGHALVRADTTLTVETYDAVQQVLRVLPTTAENFPSSETPTGIRIGWFGEDGQYAAAYGHLKPDAFAAAVDQSTRPDDPFDPEAVRHVMAVIEEDDSLAEDDHGRTMLRWKGVTDGTEHAFPLTVLNTES